ncbi:hypothetical protein Tco_1360754 [Tanacetum coccineum]
MIDKVVLIKGKLKAARDRQKSYADNRRKPIEFKIGEQVLLKVSPWKGVMHFGNKGKLAPRYVGPFEILKRIGHVAYRLRLPKELSEVHDTFHVSNLKEYWTDANMHVPLERIKVHKTLRFVKEPVKIFDREVKSLKPSRISTVNVCWNSKRGYEDFMKTNYACSDSLLLTPLCCDDIHDVTPRVSALAGCDRLVSEPLVIENILAMFFPTHKKSHWGTVFPTGLKRYKEPLVEQKEIGQLIVFEFRIDLVPRSDAVAKPPYHSSTSEIASIVEQTSESLQDMRSKEEYDVHLKLVLESLRKEELYAKSPVLWAEIGEGSLIGPDLVLETTDKVVLIKGKLKAERGRQKSYDDNRRKPLEFEIGEQVLLKVSPWKGVMHFGKKGKLAPRYVGPFEILERIGHVAYRLRLPKA